MTDFTHEWEPNFSLDRQLAEARQEYDAKHGEGAWKRRVDAEWAEAERIENERKRG